jgi:hypothetical protein
MKAFLVNRVGDFGFILGIGLVWRTLVRSITPPFLPRRPSGLADTTINICLAKARVVLDDRHLHPVVHRRDGQVGAGSAACLAA